MPLAWLAPHLMFRKYPMTFTAHTPTPDTTRATTATVAPTSTPQATCDVLRTAYQRQWITSRDGNISFREAGQNDWWITPSGALKYALTPADLKHVVGLSACPEDARHAGVSGEFALHRALHAQRVRRTTAVVHLHPTYTVAALYAGLELDKICLEFPEIARYTCVGHSVPALAATSAELAQACDLAFLACPCGQTPDIIGLDRHGVVAVGRDPWSAYEHIERLEHICQMVLASGARRYRKAAGAIRPQSSEEVF
jgi:ribulose-5-phosphate 4-epimerase/fuculose-1-phosphate aldolase